MIRPPNPHGASLDQCARWVLMLAHLYYERNVSLVSDTDYDHLCHDLADVFGELDPQLQWQLRGPGRLRATGIGFRISALGQSAACVLANDNGHKLDQFPWQTDGHAPDPWSFRYRLIRE